MNFLSPRSIYIHIPYCVSKCKYCDFFSVENKDFSVPESYVEALCNEIRYEKIRLNISYIETVYIGGGTPSLLKKTQLKRIIDAVFDDVVLSDSYEFTIEVNPDDVSKELLNSLWDLKINRISCGIQSLNNDCLSFVKRRASKKENLDALKLFSENWKGRLSLDLICGLPGESEKSFLEGLDAVVSAHPDHISMYSLTIEEETPLGKLYCSGNLDYDFDFADELWLKGRNYLEDNGYFQYEVSNFAALGKECKHNLSYWNHLSYAGFGCGATGTVYFENGEGKRYTNLNRLKNYISFWTGNTYTFEKNPVQTVENIDSETSKFEFFMMGLRKLSGVSENQYKAIFGEEMPLHIKNKFESLKQKGRCEILLTDSDVIYRFNSEGILFLNQFLEDLL